MNMAYHVPIREYKRFIMRAAKEAKGCLPVHYPDVGEVDDLISDEEFQQDEFRKDVLYYFVVSMLYGFFRDEVWHDQHPNCSQQSLQNMISYLFTPCEDLEPHVGI